MRLRTFIAASIGEAMRQVRTALGEDAVILSTEQEGKQVKVTAAIETQATSKAAAPAAADGSDEVDVARRYGGLLAAAEAGRLAFAGVGTSPEIASGLGTLRADQLCRLILPASRAESRAPGDAAGKLPGNKPPSNK